jgi:hypothetical protein
VLVAKDCLHDAEACSQYWGVDADHMLLPYREPAAAAAAPWRAEQEGDPMRRADDLVALEESGWQV